MNWHKLDNDDLVAIERSWTEQIEEIVKHQSDAEWLFHDYQLALSWARQATDSEDPVFFAGLGSSKDGIDAIVEIGDARRGPDNAHKLLNITVAPAVSIEWREEYSPAELRRHVAVIAGAIAKAAEAAAEEGCRKLKVYGRNEPMLLVFDVVMSQATEDGLPRLKRQRNWLVVELEK